MDGIGLGCAELLEVAMKLFILCLFLLFVAAGLSPQMTRPPVRARMVRVGGTPRHWQKVIALPRTIVRLEVVRLA